MNQRQLLNAIWTEIKSISIPISGMEGIVVNEDETEAYFVSDPNKKLYLINLRD